MSIRKIVPIAVVGLVSLTAACAPQPTPGASLAPTDTGNMAYPAPVASGVLNRPAPSGGTNTGSMAYPNTGRPGQTTSTTGQQIPRDTGNMAYPQPSPLGTLRTTTTP